MSRQFCAEQNEEAFVCTLEANHPGEHEAWGLTRVMARWTSAGDGVPSIIDRLRTLGVPEEALRPIVAWSEHSGAGA